MESSDDGSNSTQNSTLEYAHGTTMVLAWMVLAPTGIFIARYGRLLHIGVRRRFLGDTIWFQVHRMILALAALGTLLGFFLILVYAQGSWVDINSDGPLLYAHSIMGILVVCFAAIQVWMALFRCHPHSKFRFIYNWAHRTTGFLAFLLSIPTIFIVIYGLPLYHDGLVIILSIWTGWVVLVAISFEVLQCKGKVLSRLSKNHRTKRETAYEIEGVDHHQNEDNMVDDDKRESNAVNKIKLILLCVHSFVSIALAVPLIILIWQQN